jgi:hypothetical protein
MITLHLATESVSNIKIYDHVLGLTEGKEKWLVASNTRPFPPIKINMPGRPKTKRRSEEGEKTKGTILSRICCIIKCSLCGNPNHNKRNCKINKWWSEGTCQLY